MVIVYKPKLTCNSFKTGTNIATCLSMDERSANQYLFNVYCPVCPPGGTIVYLGGQQKRFLLFGHGRDLVAFNGTGI